MAAVPTKRPGANDGPEAKIARGANGGAVAGGEVATGEVRMGTAQQASVAIQSLNGSTLGGGIISVVADRASKDGTKLTVTNIPDGVDWQALKDHFSQAGEVKFAAVNKVRNLLSGTVEGEVRFDSVEEMQACVQMIESSEFNGHRLTIKVDANSKEGTKCFIHGIPLGTQWQELKDHCSKAGRVAYCSVKGEGGSDLGEGEIRYEDPELATAALSLDGSILMGARITVQLDSVRGDKLRVYGLPPRCQWQELKDHFGQIGPVAFSIVKKPFHDGWGFSVPGLAICEVRYEDPAVVPYAIQTLNRSSLGGATISVRMDDMSKDGSKVLVSGIPPGVDWLAIKEHFSTMGEVAFVALKGGGKDKGGKGGKGGGWEHDWATPDPWSMLQPPGGGGKADVKGMMMKGMLMKGMMLAAKGKDGNW